MKPQYFLESHNGISALLTEKSKYDGIWVSSLTHTAAKGMPDNEMISLKERAELVDEITRVSGKPVLVDMDTGGAIEHLPYNIKLFEKAGAWGVVIEDEKYPKQNSLLDATHSLEDIDTFVEKLRVAKENAKDMKVFARVESLIAKRSVWEALLRARVYVEKGGVDGKG